MSEKGASRAWGGRVALLVPLLTCLLLWSCFEPPIREELELRWLPAGGAVVTASTRILAGAPEKNNRALNERIEQARRELERGEDFWTRRIEAVHPDAERLTWEREQGRLTRSIHRVFLRESDDVNKLLSDAVSLAAYARKDEWAEVALYPLTGSRATGQQVRTVVDSLDDWSSGVARYLEAGFQLYSYLRRRPERAEACFTPIFDAFVDEKVKAAAPAPTEEEQPLVDAVKKALSDLTGMFEIPSDGAYSTDELFQLVYAPFPCRVRVRTPGKIVESEGFVAESDTAVAVPEMGLYGAVKSLEGRWLAPDPLVAYVEHGRHAEGKKFDVAAFAARERTAEPGPATALVRQAIEARLSAARVYRVRWINPQAAEEKDEIVDAWEAP